MSAEGVRCQYYALCDRRAVGVTLHPVLMSVPTCERCAARHNVELLRWVQVTLAIENTYEDGDTVRTTVRAEVEAPEEADWADDLHAWGWREIHDHTGTDRPEGDAWYDVKITESSDPRLLGRTFEFGY